MLKSPFRDADPLRGALLHAPGRRLFASRDLDETRALVGGDVAGRAQHLDLRMHHAAFGGVSLVG